MATERILTQAKAPVWIGAVQVQVANSFFYINLANTAMLAATFWYSAGYVIAGRYLPWLSIWTFAAVVVLGLAALMVFDYKYILPTRQGFMNRQAYKHDNEAMDALRVLQKDLVEMKKEQGFMNQRAREYTEHLLGVLRDIQEDNAKIKKELKILD